MKQPTEQPQDKSLTTAVLDCHELLAWIIPRLDRMPRQRRFILGGRIETLLLHVSGHA